MAEAAIVTPLLLLLVFGIIEFGFVFKDTLTLANGARAGARVGSSAQNDPLSDTDIVASIKAAMGSFADQSSLNIAVFRADGPNDSVPAACKSSSVAGLCNHYTSANFNGVIDDGAWPATSRLVSIAAGGPGYIGVWVGGHHSSVLGFGGIVDRDIDDEVVMRLEPKR